MSHLEAIGAASRPTGVVDQEEGVPLFQDEGVAFFVPYGEEGYNIRLSHQEMDKLLQAGFQKILGNQALSGFDHIVDLLPDLPLYIGARSINTQATAYGRHTVDMGVSVVTKVMCMSTAAFCLLIEQIVS
ncbi:MAG TPA: hypothetical protein VK712_01280 [Verrucomicrobiae bacterium]|jgi:hypothetical protein|nr:hypothetical protein [Verrucomicrobiae bacterium]